MATKLNGFHGKVTIGTTPVTVCVTKWDVTGSSKNDESPDTCSGGYMTRTPGMKDAKGSFSVDYDGTNAPTVEEGDEIHNLILGHTIGATFTPAFSIASAFVSSRKLTNPVPGRVSYDIDWEANGTYQWGALPVGP